MSGLVFPQRFAIPTPPPPAETQWRVNFTAGADLSFGRCLEVVEVEMRTVAGGADQCSGGTATGSSTSFTPGNYAEAFDDNYTGTSWVAGSSSVPQWLQYTFVSALSIIEAALTCNPVSGSTSPPTTFDVQYFNGSVWVTAWSVATSGTWSTNETRVFTLP